jgi:3-hydroxyacyl-CoA dehydrogenase
MGVPKTGVFGLLDLVGLDLMPHVAKSLLATLPEGDAYRALHREHDFVTRLISAGRTGRKGGKGGFYTRAKDAEATASSAPSTSGPARTARARGDAGERRARFEGPAQARGARDRGGRYARAVLLDTLSYAAALVPEIAADPGRGR